MTARELDLNIDQLRNKAARDFITNLRTAFRKFDDIDALERVLNSEETVEIAKQLFIPANGHGRKLEPLQIEAHSKKRKKWKRVNPDVDMPRLRNEALAILRKVDSGMTSVALLQMVRNSTGVIPAEIGHIHAAQALHRAMTPLVNDKTVRAQRSSLPGKPMFYVYVGAEKPHTKTPRHNVPPMPHGSIERLRTFIMSELIASKRTMIPRELTAAAVSKGGFAKTWGASDNLSNQVGRILREEAKNGMLKRVVRNSATGDIQYSVLRPSLSVTKHKP